MHQTEEKFTVNGKKFTVTFTVNSEKFTVNLTLNQKTMFELIEKTPDITVSEMAKILQISERAVKKNIAKFKSFGILSRIGSDKNGSWKIIITQQQ
jgi:ATP-dependent DNA helicase RecG